MKLVIFGVSGKTGTAVLAAALRSDLPIVGVDRLKDSHNNTEEEGITFVDYADSRRLKEIIAGSDGVFIAFGPRPPYTDIFCAEATKNIVSAMTQTGVSRLICQTGSMIGDYPKNRTFFFKKISEMYVKNNPLGYKDRVLQEEVVKNSKLSWTIIKPPRLTDATLKKRIIVGDKVVVGLLSSLSRATLAEFVIREFGENSYLNKVIFLRN